MNEKQVTIELVPAVWDTAEEAEEWGRLICPRAYWDDAHPQEPMRPVFVTDEDRKLNGQWMLRKCDHCGFTQGLVPPAAWRALTES